MPLAIFLSSAVAHRPSSSEFLKNERDSSGRRQLNLTLCCLCNRWIYRNDARPNIPCRLVGLASKEARPASHRLTTLLAACSQLR